MTDTEKHKWENKNRLQQNDVYIIIRINITIIEKYIDVTNIWRLNLITHITIYTS
jgi:hypothetical protein